MGQKESPKRSSPELLIDAVTQEIVTLDQEIQSLAHSARSLSEEQLLKNKEIFSEPMLLWEKQISAQKSALLSASELGNAGEYFGHAWSEQDQEQVRFCLGSWEPEFHFASGLVAVPYVFYHRVLLVAVAKSSHIKPDQYFQLREQCRNLIAGMDSAVKKNETFKNLNKTLFKAG